MPGTSLTSFVPSDQAPASPRLEKSFHTRAGFLEVRSLTYREAQSPPSLGHSTPAASPHAGTL